MRYQALAYRVHTCLGGNTAKITNTVFVLKMVMPLLPVAVR